MSYSHNEDPHNIDTETLEGNMLGYTVDVLGGPPISYASELLRSNHDQMQPCLLLLMITADVNQKTL